MLPRKASCMSMMRRADCDEASVFLCCIDRVDRFNHMKKTWAKAGREEVELLRLEGKKSKDTTSTVPVASLAVLYWWLGKISLLCKAVGASLKNENRKCLN